LSLGFGKDKSKPAQQKFGNALSAKPSSKNDKRQDAAIPSMFNKHQ